MTYISKSALANELDIKPIQELIREYPDEELNAYKIRSLRGKEYIGNVEEVSAPYEFEALKI